MGSTGTSMRTQKREHVKYRKTLCAQSNCLGSAEILKQTKSNHIVRWPRSCENTKRQTGGRWRTTPHTEGSPWLFRNRYFVPLPGNNRCGHSLNLTLEAGSSPGRHCLGWRLLMEFRQTWGGKRRQRSEGWLSKWWFPSWQTGKKKRLVSKVDARIHFLNTILRDMSSNSGVMKRTRFVWCRSHMMWPTVQLPWSHSPQLVYNPESTWTALGHILSAPS